MEPDDTHRLGYQRVDDDPNVSVLLATMDATARWTATRRLRTWERAQLRLESGQRLLDVGCGLGDAAVELASALDARGEVVGIDASAAMISVAAQRARSAGSRVRFVVGDALALDEPDGSFDVVRSERTLQWLSDPERAVAEMVRVVRPHGLVSLIDTDWSTFELDIGDADLTARVRESMATERNRPSTIGRHLVERVREAGLEPVGRSTATQHWASWDPDASPAPSGCFSMASLADDLVDAGQLDRAERDPFIASVYTAAREGRFSMSLTMFAVVAKAASA